VSALSVVGRKKVRKQRRATTGWVIRYCPADTAPDVYDFGVNKLVSAAIAAVTARAGRLRVSAVLVFSPEECAQGVPAKPGGPCASKSHI
jgi:hypothetical protein